MLDGPAHLHRIDSPAGMDSMWARFVPKRLTSTPLQYRKQLWYIRPTDWTNYDAYIEAHEAAVNRHAAEGGIGVVVYDLSVMTIPQRWTSVMAPFAEMHQRLHRNGSYDKWLVKTFVVVPDAMVFATLTAVLNGPWQPTRPLSVVPSLGDVSAYVDQLWLPAPKTDALG